MDIYPSVSLFLFFYFFVLQCTILAPLPGARFKHLVPVPNAPLLHFLIEAKGSWILGVWEWSLFVLGKEEFR